MLRILFTSDLLKKLNVPVKITGLESSDMAKWLQQDYEVKNHMECQNRSDKYIWSPHDAYFYKGLSELIVDIDRLIYLSLEKIRKDFVFINLNTDSLTEFINRDNEWLSAVKGKQVVLIAARKSEALAIIGITTAILGAWYTLDWVVILEKNWPMWLMAGFS